MERTIICRCEEVALEDIENTAQKYNCSAREVKLRTRAGMGYCGGRTCRPALDAVLEEVTGEKPGHDIPLKVSPPVRPLSLSGLRGNEINE
ncbi:(2Fe-2S)-binding protein [Ornithinibacillus sp. 4-3]|uniref:(2Fe-2S)-binding protein n=1 Tax=Ornithinibacillus sp. 4-3 TaxID=3231488 RepID=A0AB39HRB0_9BACI